MLWCKSVFHRDHHSIAGGRVCSAEGVVRVDTPIAPATSVEVHHDRQESFTLGLVHPHRDGAMLSWDLPISDLRRFKPKK